MLAKKVSKTAQAGSFSARYTPGLLWTKGSAAAGACALPGSGKGRAMVPARCASSDYSHGKTTGKQRVSEVRSLPHFVTVAVTLGRR
jgi:hypothetical protein